MELKFVGASLLARRRVQPPEIGRVDQRLREQVRSHALRAESRADLRIAHNQVGWCRGCSDTFCAEPGMELKFAPTPSGQNQERTCVSRTIRSVGAGGVATLSAPSLEKFVGANLFAKRLVQHPQIGRLDQCLREQVRSHALRAESCVSRPIRSSGSRSAPRIRLLPGVCGAFLDSLLNRPFAVVFSASGEEPDQEGRQ